MGSCGGLLVVTLISCLLCATASVAAELLPFGSGVLYFGAEGGWTRLTPLPASAVVPGLGLRIHDQTWHDGFNAGGRAGYEWAPWRIEEEVRFQDNDLRKFGPSGVVGSDAALALMTNLLYDALPDWPLSPHFGGGIGAAHLDASMRNAAWGTVVTGSDWVFAYQAIAGVRYSLSPSLAIDVDYRYLATETPHFRTGADFFDNGALHPGLRVTAGYESHSLTASLTVRFGVPPVVAPPPPPLVGSGRR